MLKEVVVRGSCLPNPSTGCWANLVIRTSQYNKCEPDAQNNEKNDLKTQISPVQSSENTNILILPDQHTNPNMYDTAYRIQ